MRRVQGLPCGVNTPYYPFEGVWMAKLKKPGSSLKKQSKNTLNRSDPANNSLIQYFQRQIKKKEPIFQSLDLLPVPIEVFSPDGTTVYVNRACLEMVNCEDVNLIIGNYNLLKDPVCMDQLGCRKEIERAFNGEAVSISGFPAPIQDVVDRGISKEKPWETATADISLYPVKSKKKLEFVVCVFTIRTVYYGRPEAAKAKEYINSRWKDEYDPEAAAKYSGLGVTQLYKLFKKNTGMTLGDYYKKIKVEHIKKMLVDSKLAVHEVLSECGVKNRSTYVRVFKKITGLSPEQFRRQACREKAARKPKRKK